MARVLVLFTAVSFLVGCGKQEKLTSAIERHKTPPYGLGEGVFYADADSTLLALKEDAAGKLRAYVIDWRDGEAFEFDTDARHEFNAGGVSYKIEGIGGSIVLTRGEEVVGLKSHTSEEFVSECGRRRVPPPVWRSFRDKLMASSGS